MPIEPLNVVDIFCGAGGLSAGFEDADANWSDNHVRGYKIAFGVDRDLDAINTFRARHFHGVPANELERVAPCSDVTKINAQIIREAIGPSKSVDILIGGPNCQGVSAAGLRNPDDHRNDMLRAFINLVRELRPQWFLMENVPGLTHANNRDLLATIFEEFAGIEGYTVSGDVLLAADFGVPQLRYRLFIIGTRTGSPIRFPSPTHVHPASPLGQDLFTNLPVYRTVADAIGELEEFEVKAYDKAALPDYEADDRDVPARFPKNHYSMSIAEVNRDRIATIKPGEDWRSMPFLKLPERFFATRASDQKGAYGRLNWDWPAYTITNAACNVTAGPFTHPSISRGLSVREVARLQSFSDDHIFHGYVLSQYRQVGNAVPPLLAKAVAEAILFCHHKPDAARDWGSAGRLTSESITKSLAKAAPFPVVTPKVVHPDHDRRRKSNRKPSAPSEKVVVISAWDSNRRDIVDGRDLASLKRLANEPGHYRATKRAKAILQFIEGAPKDEIVKSANASEVSVKKWVDGYIEHGIDGWRAYHTSLKKIAGGDTDLLSKLEEATEKARELTVGRNDNDDSGPKRLYMNDYLLDLIGRFGNASVSELIRRLDCLGVDVGTTYVGDLLAIADVVLAEEVEGAIGPCLVNDIATSPELSIAIS